MYISVNFTVNFTALYNHHHKLILEHIIPPKKGKSSYLLTENPCTSLSLHLSLRQLLIYFLSLQICFLGTFHVTGSYNMLSSRALLFQFLYLDLRFQFICLFGVSWGSKCIFFAFSYPIQLFQSYSFKKDYSSLLNYLSTSVKKQLTTNVRVIYGFPILFHWSI